MERHRVDVSSVTPKCLLALVGTQIPQANGSVNRPGQKHLIVRGLQAQGRNVSIVTIQTFNLLLRFKVPLHNFHVARALKNLLSFQPKHLYW